MQATAQNSITVSLCGATQTVTFDGGADDRIKSDAVVHTNDYDVLLEARALVRQIAARWQGDSPTDEMTQHLDFLLADLQEGSHAGAASCGITLDPVPEPMKAIEHEQMVDAAAVLMAPIADGLPVQ